jgi:hypothetical protein
MVTLATCRAQDDHMCPNKFRIGVDAIVRIRFPSDRATLFQQIYRLLYYYRF